MWPIVPAWQTLLVLGVMFATAMVSLRLFQPEWWRSRGVRIVTLASFATTFCGIAAWVAGRMLDRLSLVHAGAGIAYAGILIVAPAVVLLPAATLLDRLLIRLLAHPPAPASVAAVAAKAPSSALSRRALIRATTGSLPAMAALTGASGLVSARLAPRIAVVPMRFEGLHPDLDGLRILQLSDLHLGVYATLNDLASALDTAIRTQRPDLIVLTGDLADDTTLITGALALVAQARPRLGALASLGNHEYLHGIGVTRPLYEASRVPLLVSAGRTITVGRARLYVAGSDDPVHLHGDVAAMLRPSITAAAAMAPHDADFRLLLCHRPEGFGPATDAGFDLTLSGHTHGGQIGLFGRSLFEKLMPGTGWWGTYARARPGRSPSRLYTTSGFGHWFPFRVGCPTEMPVVVLQRSPARDADPATRPV